MKPVFPFKLLLSCFLFLSLLSCNGSGTIIAPLNPLELSAQAISGSVSLTSATVETPIQLTLNVQNGILGSGGTGSGTAASGNSGGASVSPTSGSGSGGTIINASSVAWSLADPSAGTLTATGLFTPNRSGKVTVIAQFGDFTRNLELDIKSLPVEGNRELEVPVQPVAPPPPANSPASPAGGAPDSSGGSGSLPTSPTQPDADKNPTTPDFITLSILPSKLTLSAVGVSNQFTLTAKDSKGNPVDISTLNLSWESDKPTIISVDQTGKVTALQSGFATISVKISGTASSVSALVQVGTSGSSAPSGGGTGDSGEVAAEVDFN